MSSTNDIIISIEQVPPTSTMGDFSCSLCCEDKTIAGSCALSSCGHQSCNSCMVKWIEKEEASGQNTLPTCPFCRVNMTEQDIMSILKRPFQPKRASPAQASDEADLDELTLHWLNEHTVPCQSCGARIEKIEGGCDMMECLCGWRFCYRCGSQGANCSCTPAHHYFWDNVLGRTGGNRASAPLAAPRNEETGQVNLREHIQKRKDKEHAEMVRKERRARKGRIEIEQSLEAAQLSSSCTSNGRWLHCTTTASSLQMLSQQVRAESKQKERVWRAKSHQAEIDAGTIFLSRSRIAFCGNFSRRVEIGHNAATATNNGRWLFSCAGVTGSQAMLRQQLLGQTKQEARLRKNHRNSVDVDEVGTDWLFLDERSASIRVLKEQILGARERRRRTSQRQRNYKEYTSRLDFSAVWLFLPQKTAFRILSEEIHASRVRQNRKHSKSRIQRSPDSQVDLFVQGGSWLFANKTPKKTCQHLTRLLKHVLGHCDEMEIDESIFEMLLDRDDDCLGHIGWCKRRSNHHGNEIDEETNLQNILLVFPCVDDS